MPTFRVSISVEAEIIIDSDDEQEAYDLAQGVSGLSLNNSSFRAMQDVQITYVNVNSVEEK